MIESMLDKCVDFAQNLHSVYRDMGNVGICKDSIIIITLNSKEDRYKFSQEVLEVPYTEELVRSKGFKYELRVSDNDLTYNITTENLDKLKKFSIDLDEICREFVDITNCYISSNNYVFLSFLGLENKEHFQRLLESVVQADISNFNQVNYKGIRFCFLVK